MMEQYFSPASITLFAHLCDMTQMQIGLFYNLDVAHNKNSLENGPN